MAVLGAGLGGLFFGLAAVIAEFLLRREGLGWGDVKFVAMIGAFLGPRHGMFALLLGCVFAVSFGVIRVLRSGRSGYLPFGPALALGAAIWLFYGDVLARVWLPDLRIWG
jgi:leader peptidase (prepilin peptidase)/N-methyltransferase